MPLLTGIFSASYGWGRSGGPTNFLEIIVDTVLLVSCQDIITLRATVLSETDNHLYFWTQISGPPVTWLEPQNQTEVTFQRPTGGVNSDFIFRFWVDKDTPYEQYRDLIVTNTARDDFIYNTTIQNSGSIVKYNYFLDPVTSVSIIPALSSLGSVTVNNANKSLQWINTTATYPVVHTKTEILRSVAGTLQSLAILPPTSILWNDWPNNQPNTSDTYVIRAHWDLYNAGQITGYTDTSAFSFTSTVLVDTAEQVQTDLVMQNSGNMQLFQTQIVTLAALDNQDTVSEYSLEAITSGSLSVFQTQIVTLLDLPASLSDTANNIAINTQTSGQLSIFQTQISGGIILV
jgi:hypothetical protein